MIVDEILRKTYYAIVGLSILVPFHSFGLYKPITGKSAPIGYHQTMTYKRGQHIPLIFIVNQLGDETPHTSGIANTYTLNLALLEENAAILVSKSVLYNFIYRQAHADTAHVSFPLDADRSYKTTQIYRNWEVYRLSNPEYFTDNTELVLLIPLKKRTLFLPAFNGSRIEIITTPGSLSHPAQHLVNFLDKNKTKPSHTSNDLHLISKDLEKIFSPLHSTSLSTDQALLVHKPEHWDAPIFDIVLHGHGVMASYQWPTALIANFTPQELERLLSFFNSKLRIGALIIQSCYSGGTNLKNFKFKEIFDRAKSNKSFYTLNFIVISMSSADTISFSFPSVVSYSSKNSSKKIFEFIFEALENLGTSKKYSLENLLKALGRLAGDQSDFPLHKESNIPQIILPGGIDIQTLTPDKNIMVLGAVKAKTAALENKTIKIIPQKRNNWFPFTDPLNVLVYSSIVNAPLLIGASNMYDKVGLRKKILEQWKKMPTYSDLVISNSHVFPMQYGQNAAWIGYNYQYLYPNFIPMDYEHYTQYFKHIELQGNAQAGSGGLLMGIRDCFLSNKNYIKIFIDTLQGPNDISLILKTLRIIRGEFPTISSIENELPPDGDSTILHNVKIWKLLTGEPAIWFEINNTAWRIRLNSEPWVIEQLNLNEYRALYQEQKDEILERHHEISYPQKSLLTVMQDKALQIKRDKDLLVKTASLRTNLFRLSSPLHSLANAKHRQAKGISAK